MKKYIYILIIPVLFSCKKQLQEQAFSSVVSENFYKTSSDAISALYGVYNELNRANTDWDNYMYSMVFVPSEYVETKVVQRKVYSNFKYGTSDATIEAVWKQAYVAINRANAVIDNVPTISMNDSLKKEIVAEAKFIRALSYFNLVRLYGGVPMRVHQTVSLADGYLPRSTASQVYDLIISDLTEAETNLPDVRPSTEAGRVISGAASGLLGKVYLTMAGNPLKQTDKWSLARDKFKYIMDNKARWGYTLMTSYKDVFSLTNQNNKEIMFSIQFSHVTGQGSVLAFYCAPLNSPFATGNGQYHFGFTPTFYNLFAASDTIRRNTTMVYSYTDINGKLVTYNKAPKLDSYQEPFGIALGKYQDGTGAPSNVNHANDIIVLRYADILLMFAESENEVNNGPDQAAIDAINQVRARAKTTLASISNTNYNTYGLFQAAIRKERLFELSGELTEFFDIQRWGTLQTTIANSPEAITAKTTFDNKYYLYPIPLSEIDANPLIGQQNQNPGW